MILNIEHKEFCDLLWKELRLECCASKLEAKTIIQLKEHDLQKVIKKILKELS